MKRPNHIYCISCGCALTTDERTICKHCSPESYYEKTDEEDEFVFLPVDYLLAKKNKILELFKFW